MNHSARRINMLAKNLDARRYLEIGVSRGDTFREVAIAERTGVDPAFAFNTNEIANELTRLVPLPSDAFFANEPCFPPYDLIYIDGLHKFEQVVRDFGNALLRAHRRSVIIVDDTLPNDAYSAIPDAVACMRHRKTVGSDNGSWHGDVFKLVFYIHDFWPGLNYCTVVGSGNPQTIVWRAQNCLRKPLFDSLESISRLTYFDLRDHLEILQMTAEDDAISRCVAEVMRL
nr:class I SAM-dependent methyltransferase [uncultured Rhodopila sp.]